MKCKRILSMLVILALVLSMFGAMLTVSAAMIVTTPTGYTKASDVAYKTYDGSIVNWGARGEDCVFLSKYAASYYTGNYTYSKLSSYAGGSSTANAASSALYKELKSMMTSKHDYETSYNATRDMFCRTDCLRNDYNHISSFYSGKELNGDWDGGSTWNREHTWPNSKGLNGNDENDIMMLRPTWVQENSDRGNTAYGEGSSYYDPGEATRGDCARIVLYIYTRWGNTSRMWGTGGVMESLDILLKWMEEDPVDTWEMGRNDAVESITGVRNVFVDYPEYAWLLFGRELPADMVTPSGIAMDTAPSYKITAVSNNTSYGTVSLSGKVITAKPMTGYEVTGAVVSPANAATLTRSGNTFTLSDVTADCTVTVNFAPRKTATVTYAVPAGVSCTASVNAYIGDSIRLPAPTGVPSGADGAVFVGWAASEIEKTTTKPSVKAANSSYTVTADEEFYAVYSYSIDGVTHYAFNPIICEHLNTESQHKDPTCTETGYDRVVCLDCGTIISSTTLSKVAHEYESTVVEPTCTEVGYTLYACKNCGDSYRKNWTDPLGHNYEATVVAPTCTEGGYTSHVCVNCGDSYEDSKTDPLGHNYENGVCTNCGEEDPNGGDPVHDCPCDDYTDLDNTQWYHEGVDYALKNGLMNGVGNGMFEPDGALTRAMLVTILYRAEGSPSVEGLENPFEDVLEGEWYADAIVWAAEEGIVKGHSETEFAPDDPITREQIAVILWRYTDEPIPEGDVSTFPDADEINSYGLEALKWAVGVGLINGTLEDGISYLAPQGNATRAQIATILWRYLEK